MQQGAAKPNGGPGAKPSDGDRWGGVVAGLGKMVSGTVKFGEPRNCGLVIWGPPKRTEGRSYSVAGSALPSRTVARWRSKRATLRAFHEGPYTDEKCSELSTPAMSASE